MRLSAQAQDFEQHKAVGLFIQVLRFPTAYRLGVSRRPPWPQRLSAGGWWW